MPIGSGQTAGSGRQTPDRNTDGNSEAAVAAVEAKTIDPYTATEQLLAAFRASPILSEALLKNPALDPETEGAKYIDAEKGVADVPAALEGA